MFERAAALASRAHAGQTDLQDCPYVDHLFRVAERVEDPQAKVVALLHDVLEDTKVTYDELVLDFPEEVCGAVLTVTHSKEEETYEQFIERVAKAEGRVGELARAVKVA